MSLVMQTLDATRSRLQQRLTRHKFGTDALRVAAFLGVYWTALALSATIHPLVLALAVSLTISVLVIVKRDPFQEDRRAALFALGTLIAIILLTAAFNSPLAMQRLLTYGGLLIFALDGVRALYPDRVMAKAQGDSFEPGKREARAISALSALLVVIVNEVGILFQNDPVWIALMACHTLFGSRLFAVYALKKWAA